LSDHVRKRFDLISVGGMNVPLLGLHIDRLIDLPFIQICQRNIPFDLDASKWRYSNLVLAVRPSRIDFDELAYFVHKPDRPIFGAHVAKMHIQGPGGER